MRKKLLALSPDQLFHRVRKGNYHYPEIIDLLMDWDFGNAFLDIALAESKPKGRVIEILASWENVQHLVHERWGDMDDILATGNGWELSTRVYLKMPRIPRIRAALRARTFEMLAAGDLEPERLGVGLYSVIAGGVDDQEFAALRLAHAPDILEKFKARYMIYTLGPTRENRYHDKETAIPLITAAENLIEELSCTRWLAPHLTATEGAATTNLASSLLRGLYPQVFEQGYAGYYRQLHPKKKLPPGVPLVA